MTLFPNIRQTTHVPPIGDLIVHDLTSVHCWCAPDLISLNGIDRLVVHHAADGREKDEQDLRGFDLTRVEKEPAA